MYDANNNIKIFLNNTERTVIYADSAYMYHFGDVHLVDTTDVEIWIRDSIQYDSYSGSASQSESHSVSDSASQSGSASISDSGPYPFHEDLLSSKIHRNQEHRKLYFYKMNHLLS